MANVRRRVELYSSVECAGHCAHEASAPCAASTAPHFALKYCPVLQDVRHSLQLTPSAAVSASKYPGAQAHCEASVAPAGPVECAGQGAQT